MVKEELNYTLIILNKGIEKNVVDIAEDISVIANSEKVKYFFNDTHHIYTFKSNESFNIIKEWSEMMLTDFKSGYLLLPYDVENSLIELPKDVKTHLFESNVGEINEKEIIENINDKLKDEFQLLIEENINFEEEDEIVNIRNKKRKKSLNEILDKIYDKGIDSISENEKQILKQISNKK
tara:strand:- start:29 stop:568 length:540 start_codon:yes stop_codon:yes gene_type:complete